MFNWAFEDRLAWELRLLAEQDAYEVELVKREEAIAEGRKQGLEKGFRQGFQEGFREGLREGFQQGLEEGRRLRRLQTAKNLLAMGMQLEQIASAVGFDIETVNSWIFGDTVPVPGASSKKSHRPLSL
jgi:flagellar biosynthesis/type III secretory pathway protein FliH